MGSQFITGNEAYRPEAELLVNAMRVKSHDDKVDILADALRQQYRKALDTDFRWQIDASSISATLTSATARVIGLAIRDGHLDALDRCATILSQVDTGLEEFAMLAGSDTGAEPIQVVLRELVGYLKERDYDGASAALDRRMAASKGKPTDG